MANEATIDELQIEISTTSGSAASNLDDLAKSLERLEAVTSRITGSSKGLNKIAKQIDKLNEISQKIQSMRGFERLGKVVDQLSKLDRLNHVGDISGFVRNANKLPQAVNALAQMPSVDGTKFQQLADALKPLEAISAGNINSTLNSLRKIPKLSQELAGVDFAQFTQQMEQTARAIEPLARQAERSGQGLTALAQIMQQTNRTARQSSDGVSLFNRAVGDIKVKTLAAVAALRRLFSALKNGITASAAYVENLNLFSVTMGDSADEALRFAENVNAALGVDTSDWIRYQGVFQSIGKGFGIVSSQADVMSKNLTQLSYDISSFYNITADVAAEKLQSALSGQVMPMRQLGFAIEETTLKQVALNHGITASVENMTQAQKAQLRYIAIMEQAGNIGVLGDMARTIDTASNGMRVLEARIQQFSRAIGNMLMPMLSAVLPYATAFVQVLTEGAQAIANFFGFELPKIDFSDAQVSSGFDDITGAIDEATEANEAFKGSLASIDQLNIIGSDSENKNAANMGNQFDLGITLPEYDFLQGVESKTKQIAENLRQLLPVVEAIGTGIAVAFAGTQIVKFIDWVKTLLPMLQGVKTFLGTKTGGVIGGLAVGATSGILLYDSVKNLIKDTGSLGGNIAKLASGLALATGAVVLFVKLGNPLGAVITAVGAAIGLVAGAATGIKEAAEQKAMERITEAFERGITPISDVADAFGTVADNLSSSEINYLNAKTDLLDISTNAQSAGTQIDNMISALKGAGTLSENELSTMTKAFEDLAKASEQYIQTSNNNFKLYILANQDMLKAQGYSVSSMVELINQSTEKQTSKIDDLEARANELINLQKTSGLDETQIMELENINKQLLQMSGVDIELNIDTKGAEDVLNSFTSIKFTDPQNAAEGLQKTIDAVAEAYFSLEETKKGLFSDIDSLDIELGDKEMFKGAINAIVESKKSLLDEKFSDPLGRLFQQTDALKNSVVAAKAQETADKGLWGFFPGGEHWEAVFGKSYEDIATNKAKAEMGDAASIIFNPTESLYKAFAERGFSKDYTDSIFSDSKELGATIPNNIAGGINEGKGAIDGAFANVQESISNGIEKIQTDIANYNKKSFIPDLEVDWSKYHPPLADTSESARIGYAREAYGKATQSSTYAYNSPDEIEAYITINNYLDGDLVDEKLEIRRVDMQRRMNGR